jgi:hypothetical protein
MAVGGIGGCYQGATPRTGAAVRAGDDWKTYTATRSSLHAVAEHVLGAALHAATGRIGLRPTPGGFGTPPFPSVHGPRQLRVDGIDLVDRDDRGERRTGLTTLRAAATFVGIEAGAPAGVYRPVTPLDLDAPLTVDGPSAARLAGWFALVGRALARLSDDLAGEGPSAIQLWPEHFDVATTISRVNYGGSPGDDGHSQPYLYVGPWDLPPPEGSFWNEPFGASLPAEVVRSDDDALAFFRKGRERL